MTRLLKQFILTAMLALFASQASALFVQPDTFDPRMQGVGTNRYAYAGGDPVNRSDPNGHQYQGIGMLLATTNDPEEQQRIIDATAASALSMGPTAMEILTPYGDLKDIYEANSAMELSIAIGLAAIGPIGDLGRMAKKLPGLDVPNSVPDSTLVCRGGTCQADHFANGSGVTIGADGELGGISVQSAPGADIETLSRPFKNNQVGVTTVGEINQAGGSIVFDGTPFNPNHATVSGLTPSEAQRLFTPTIPNPVPKNLRGPR